MSQMFPLWGEVRGARHDIICCCLLPELLRAELNPEVRGWPTAPRNLSNLGPRIWYVLVPEAWETQITHICHGVQSQWHLCCAHQVGAWEWRVPENHYLRLCSGQFLPRMCFSSMEFDTSQRGCAFYFSPSFPGGHKICLRFHSPLPIT